MSTQKRFLAKNGIDNNGKTLTNVTDPVNAQDASTKNFSSNASNLTTGTLLASLLANSGITAGAYGTATKVPTTVFDAKGRATGVVETLITPDFSNVTNKPTTLAGYGITDGSSSGSFTNPVFTGLLGATLPSGATADREATPANGRIRFNTTLGAAEGFTPRGWVGINNVILKTYSADIGQASGNTVIPFDNTTPLITEGTQLWSQVIDPIFDDSRFLIHFSGFVSCNSSKVITIALFRNNTLISTSCSTVSSNSVSSFNINTMDAPATSSPITYSLRIGVTSSSTWYFNRGSNASMGGVNKSSVFVAEV